MYETCAFIIINNFKLDTCDKHRLNIKTKMILLLLLSFVGLIKNYIRLFDTPFKGVRWRLNAKKIKINTFCSRHQNYWADFIFICICITMCQQPYLHLHVTEDIATLNLYTKFNEWTNDYAANHRLKIARIYYSFRKPCGYKYRAHIFKAFDSYSFGYLRLLGMETTGFMWNTFCAKNT